MSFWKKIFGKSSNQEDISEDISMVVKEGISNGVIDPAQIKAIIIIVGHGASEPVMGRSEFLWQAFGEINPELAEELQRRGLYEILFRIRGNGSRDWQI